jgi:N-acetylmuramoyl-L-alanine amidase
VRALVVLAFLAAMPAVAGESSALVVALDPGHGGKFPHDGAHGPRGVVEKNVALAVALKLKALLEAQGATVVLTREDDADVPLPQRAQIANEAGADLFLSIHCNSMETREDRLVTRGVETYFLSPDATDAEAKMLAEMENGGPGALPVPKKDDPLSGILADLALGQARNDSAELARIVHHQMIRGTWATSRGVRQAPFLVLSGTRMPSALVEIGFISHPQESRQLAKEKYQARVAQALAESVREFAEKVLARRLYAGPAARTIPVASSGVPTSGSAGSSVATSGVATSGGAGSSVATSGVATSGVAGSSGAPSAAAAPAGVSAPASEAAVAAPSAVR